MNESTEVTTSAAIKTFFVDSDGAGALAVGSNLEAMGRALSFEYDLAYGSSTGATVGHNALLIKSFFGVGCPTEDLLPLTLLITAHMVRSMNGSSNQVILSEAVLETIKHHQLDTQGWLGSKMELISDRYGHVEPKLFPTQTGNHLYQIPYLALIEWAREKGYVLENTYPLDEQALRVEQLAQDGTEYKATIVYRENYKGHAIAMADVTISGASRSTHGHKATFQIIVEKTDIVGHTPSSVQMVTIDEMSGPLSLTGRSHEVALQWPLAIAIAQRVGQHVLKSQSFRIGVEVSSDAYPAPVDMLFESKYLPYHHKYAILRVEAIDLARHILETSEATLDMAV